MNMSATSERSEEKFRAGFKLLDKFQGQWAQIHSKSENNVSKTKLALKKLNLVERSCSSRLEALDEFIDGYKTLPMLNEQIKNIEADLRTLESNFVQIEELLLTLKCHKERIDAENYIREADANYESKIQERVYFSDARKEKLKLDHLQRVEAFEREQQRELEERRSLLEKAFEEEKSRYLEKSTNNP